MERFRRRESKEDHGPVLADWPEWMESERLPGEEWKREKLLRAQAIMGRYEREQKKRSTRRKWGGISLILFGVATGVTSCPFYAFSLIGPETILASLGFLVAGGALMMSRPKVKETTQALMIALKYGNELTVTRLALEMDISLEKAEKIVKEMVRNDIAEIDLDHQDPDHALVYRIKGL